MINTTALKPLTAKTISQMLNAYVRPGTLDLTALANIPLEPQLFFWSGEYFDFLLL
jgi:hypothetical protein